MPSLSHISSLKAFCWASDLSGSPVVCFNNCSPGLVETQPLLVVQGFRFLHVLLVGCTPSSHHVSDGKQRESRASHSSCVTHEPRLPEHGNGGQNSHFAWKSAESNLMQVRLMIQVQNPDTTEKRHSNKQGHWTSPRTLGTYSDVQRADLWVFISRK